MNNLESIVNQAWDNRELLHKKEVTEAIQQIIDQLDRGLEGQ